MNDHPSSPSLPELPVALGLAGPLRSLASAAHPQHEALRIGVAAGAGWLLKILGIPGRPVVSLKDSEDGSMPGPMLALTVNGHPCAPGGEAAAGLLERAARYAGESGASPVVLVEMVKAACLQMIKDRPEVLLEAAQAEAAGQELPRPRRRKGESLPSWPPDAGVLLPALRVPVSLGITIADRPKAAQIVGANTPLWEAPEDLGELLAGGLCAQTIAIFLPSTRFQELTLAWQEKGPEAFSQRRLALAKDLGLNLPPFSLRASAELTADQFAFQVQHIPGAAQSGVTLDNLLEKLDAEIRRCLPRLVVAPRVDAQLGLVDAELRAVVDEQISLPHLTRELRRRAQAGGSLRRLPLILEELLDAPFAAAGASGSLALK